MSYPQSVRNMPTVSQYAPQFANSENVARKEAMSSLDLLDLVNAARLEFGESEVRRSDFTARCKDELSGEYYETFVVHNLRGPASEALKLTFDQCMLISMRESKAVRRKVVASLNAAKPVSLPSHVEALRLYADQLEENQRVTHQLSIAAPKIEFVDRYVESTGLKGFRQVAKLLNANESRFRTFLKERRVMYKLGGEWVPFQPHIDAGRFEVKAGASDEGHAFNQAKFTPKGVNWVAGLWAQFNLEGSL